MKKQNSRKSKKKGNSKIGIFIFIILIIAIGYYGNNYFKEKSKNQKILQIPHSSLTDILPDSKDYVVKQKQIYVKIKYPVYAESAPFFAVANASIRAKVKNEVDDFLKNEKDPNITPSSSNDPSTLTGNYVLGEGAYDTLPITFSLSSFSSGGAHPYDYDTVLTLDTQTGRLVENKNFFKGKNYVKILSEISLDFLKEKFKNDGPDSYFPDGASADVDNFSEMRLDPQTLTIIFNPYQVAPYSVGKIEVPISLEKLKNVLSVEFGGK